MMNTPTTPRAALQQCELLWKNLAETGSQDKYTACLSVLGYEPRHDCPACEYAARAISEDRRCWACPIKEWNQNAVGCRIGCLATETPYFTWLHSPVRDLEVNAANAACVLALIQKNLAELES